MATVHSALTDLLDPLGDCMTPEVASKVGMRCLAPQGVDAAIVCELLVNQLR